MLSERRGAINLHNLFESHMASKSCEEEVVVVSNLTQLGSEVATLHSQMVVNERLPHKNGGKFAQSVYYYYCGGTKIRTCPFRLLRLLPVSWYFKKDCN